LNIEGMSFAINRSVDTSCRRQPKASQVVAAKDPGLNAEPLVSLFVVHRRFLERLLRIARNLVCRVRLTEGDLGQTVQSVVSFYPSLKEASNRERTG
jgi:hypothetical protein